MSNIDPKIEEIGYGKPITCTPEEYPALRRRVLDRACELIDQQQDIRASMMLAAIERCDRVHRT